MRLLLLGPPGAGKGTQGTMLARALHLPRIAMGDIVRDHIMRGTSFGRRVEAGIASGNFAPDEDVTFWLWDKLGRLDTRDGFILDGFPRDMAQAQAFDARWPQGRAFDIVAEMTAAREALEKRLAGRRICPICDRVYNVHSCPPVRPGICDFDGHELVQRPDDEAGAVKHRFDVYEAMTLPLRRYYEHQGILKVVDADRELDQVQETLHQVIAGAGRELKKETSEVY